MLNFQSLPAMPRLSRNLKKIATEYFSSVHLRSLHRSSYYCQYWPVLYHPAAPQKSRLQYYRWKHHGRRDGSWNSRSCKKSIGKMKKPEVEDNASESFHFPLQGTKVLDTQVAGHRYGNSGKKMGMLDGGNGIVLKALQLPPRGSRELCFYRTVFAQDCRDKDLLELRNFLPFFYGTQTVDDVIFLEMANLTYGFTEPNILDLKMGQVTYDPEATSEKRKSEEAKYPPLKQLGFQFTGMMMHDPNSGTCRHFTKEFCRSITTETMLTEGLGQFFGLTYGSVRKDVLEVLLYKLNQIEDWFKIQRKFAFYASSLLIIYNSIRHQTLDTETTLVSHSHCSQELLPTSDCDKTQERTVDQKSLPMSVCDKANFPSTHMTSILHSDKVLPADCPMRDIGIRVNPNHSVRDIGFHCLKKQTNDANTSWNELCGLADGLSACQCRHLPLVEVKMIDFAHVFPSCHKDNNYLFGLQKLIQFLQQLLTI